MRYRKHRTRSGSLGQFFTPSDVASLLASGLRQAPNSFLELGAGEGALVAAVLERFPLAKATLVELDGELSDRLRIRFPGHDVVEGNVLTQLDQLPVGHAYPSIVGNPPFGEFAVTPGDQTPLRTLFPDCDRGGWIRQDLAFLHESWCRLKSGGEMALLIASPIINDPAFASVRRWILEDAGTVSVCELPEGVFAGAEVGSFILTARHRGRGRKAKAVHIDRYHKNGHLEGRLDISRIEAIERMDYKFHAIRQAAGGHWLTSPSLVSLGASVVRGSRSHGHFRDAGVAHLHTSDFAEGASRLRLGSCRSEGVQLAERGDILVPRVGSRCLLREAMVVSGTRPITEAVYRIRIDARQQARIFNALTSESGRLWRHAHARGSCAKHLTVTDLLRLPVA